MAKNTPPTPPVKSQDAKPIDALNFLYTATRNLQVNAETHERIREAALNVAAALEELEKFKVIPAAKE